MAKSSSRFHHSVGEFNDVIQYETCEKQSHFLIFKIFNTSSVMTCISVVRSSYTALGRYILTGFDVLRKSSHRMQDRLI